MRLGSSKLSWQSAWQSTSPEWCSKAAWWDGPRPPRGHDRRLFQGSTKGTPRWPRGQDDRCPTCRQADGDEHADVFRERWLDGARAHGGRRQRPDRAELGERSRSGPSERLPARAWDTGSADELAIPKLRQGPTPSFWSRAARAGPGRGRPGGLRQRGVDPQVDRLVEQWACTAEQGPGLRRCRGLDEQVRAFRERPLRAPIRICGRRQGGAGPEPGGVRHKAW